MSIDTTIVPVSFQNLFDSLNEISARSSKACLDLGQTERLIPDQDLEKEWSKIRQIGRDFFAINFKDKKTYAPFLPEKLWNKTSNECGYLFIQNLIEESNEKRIVYYYGEHFYDEALKFRNKYIWSTNKTVVGTEIFRVGINLPKTEGKFEVDTTWVKPYHLFLQFYRYKKESTDEGINYVVDRKLESHLFVDLEWEVKHDPLTGRIIYEDKDGEFDDSLPENINRVKSYAGFCSYTTKTDVLKNKIVYPIWIFETANPDEFIFETAERVFARAIVDKMRYLCTYKIGNTDISSLRKMLQHFRKYGEMIDSSMENSRKIINRVVLIPLLKDKSAKAKVGLRTSPLSKQGQFCFDWTSPVLYKRSRGDLFTPEKIFRDYSSTDLMIKKLGMNFIPNNAESRTKGIHVLANFDITLKRQEMYPYTKEIMHNDKNFAYKAPGIGVIENKIKKDFCYYVFYPVKEGSPADRTTSIKKLIVRLHALVSGKKKKVDLAFEANSDKAEERYAETFALNSFEKEVPVVYNNERTSLILNRNKVYLAHDIKDYGSVNPYGTNAIVAYVELDPRYKDMGLEDFCKKSPEEIEEMAHVMNGVDCHVMINNDIADTPLLLNKKFMFSMNKGNYSELTNKIISSINNGVSYKLDRSNSSKSMGQVARCKHCKNLLSVCSETIIGSQTYLEFDFNSPLKKNGIVVENAGCPTCGLKQVPRVFDLYLTDTYDYSSMEFFDYSIDEDEEGITFSVRVITRQGMSRLTSCSIKAVGRHMHQDYIGYASGTIENPDSPTGESIKIEGLPVDILCYYSANKGGVNGIAFSQLGLFNFLFNKKICLDRMIKDEAAERTDSSLLALGSAIGKIEKYINSFTQFDIERLMYDTETKTYVMKKQKCWIGLDTISASEIADEFIKVKTQDDPAKFSYEHERCLHEWGMSDLAEALREASYEGHSAKYKEIVEELLKIYHNDISDLTKDQEIPICHVKANGDAVLDYWLSPPAQDDKIFVTEHLDKTSFLKMATYHPLLKKVVAKTPDGDLVNAFWKPQYEKGSYVTLRVKENGEFVEKHIRLPSHDLMINPEIIKIMPSKFVHLSSFAAESLRLVYKIVAYMNKLVNSSNFYITQYNNGKEEFGFIGTGKKERKEKLIQCVREKYPFYEGNLKSYYESILEILCGKDNLLQQMSSLYLPSLNGKEVGGPLPPGVVVYGDKSKFKKLYNEYREANGMKRVDSITADHVIYGMSMRAPEIFLMQAINVVEIWNIQRAEEYFMKKFGISFKKMFPNFKSIMISCIDQVMLSMSDSDGDFRRELVPYTLKAQDLLKAYNEKLRGYQFLINPPSNTTASLVIKDNFQWAFNYLMKEYKDNCIPYDLIKLNLYVVDPKEMNQMLTLEADTKNRVSLITIAMWTFNDILECCLREQEITVADKIRLSSFYRNIILQEGTVRALKKASELSEMSLDKLVENKEFFTEVKDATDNFVQAKITPQKLLENTMNETGYKDVYPQFQRVIEWYQKAAGYTWNAYVKPPMLVRDSDLTKPIFYQISMLRSIMFGQSYNVQYGNSIRDMFVQLSEIPHKQLLTLVVMEPLMKIIYNLKPDSEPKK